MKGPRFAPWDNRRQPHPDDVAVDDFALAMKRKLADARAKGRFGWNDGDDVTEGRLSRMLRDHVEKGDPLDVANFAMFLHQRGERITKGVKCLRCNDIGEREVLPDAHRSGGIVPCGCALTLERST